MIRFSSSTIENLHFNFKNNFITSQNRAWYSVWNNFYGFLFWNICDICKWNDGRSLPAQNGRVKTAKVRRQKQTPLNEYVTHQGAAEKIIYLYCLISNKIIIDYDNWITLRNCPLFHKLN